MEEHLQLQERIHQQTTVGDVQRKFQAEPYGWREVDVAATVARLLAGQRATVLFAGAPVACTDRDMINYLRKNADKARIKRRVKMNEALLKKCRDILGDFTGARDIPCRRRRPGGPREDRAGQRHRAVPGPDAPALHRHARLPVPLPAGDRRRPATP